MQIGTTSIIGLSTPQNTDTLDNFFQFCGLYMNKKRQSHKPIKKLNFIPQLIADAQASSYPVIQNIKILGRKNRPLQTSQTLEDITLKKNICDVITKHDLVRPQILDREKRSEKLLELGLPLPKNMLTRILEEVDEKKERWFPEQNPPGAGPQQMPQFSPRVRKVSNGSNNYTYIIAFSKKEIYFTCLDKSNADTFIGEGSYKSVYKVWRITKPKLLALSESRMRIGTYSHTEEFWDAEEACLNSLNGKKIDGKHVAVKLHAGFRSESSWEKRQILIMKYFPLDLETFIAQNMEIYAQTKQSILPDQIKIDLGIKIMKRIAYFHSLGISSLDLKASNFLFNEGQVVAMDFGLACLNKMQHTHKDQHGTPLYFPYEYFAKLTNLACRPIDIWCAACILWCLFAEKNYVWLDHMDSIGYLNATVMNDVASLIEAFNKNGPYASLPLKQLFWEMWQIDPAKRPNAQEVVTKLEQIQSNLSEDCSFEFPALLA